MSQRIEIRGSERSAAQGMDAGEHFLVDHGQAINVAVRRQIVFQHFGRGILPRELRRQLAGRPPDQRYETEVAYQKAVAVEERLRG